MRHWFVPELRVGYFSEEDISKGNHLYCIVCGTRIDNLVHFTTKENDNMPNLEVEVMLENHPHLFVVEIDSVLEAPKVGASMKCGKCGVQGTIARVGVPGRKGQREQHIASDNQSSILKEE
jgi:hypothetical protein